MDEFLFERDVEPETQKEAGVFDIPSFDLCRFRQNHRCIYPHKIDVNVSRSSSTIQWTTVDRGLCERVEWKGHSDSQEQCPLSIPKDAYQKYASGTVGELFRRLDAVRSQFAVRAQEIYDQWEQDENGEDFTYGTGGICDAIVNNFTAVVVNAPWATDDVRCLDGGQDGDDHAWLIVVDDSLQEAVGVDIPPGVYEVGGGYTWTKLPQVRFNASHVMVFPLHYEDVADAQDWGDFYSSKIAAAVCVCGHAKEDHTRGSGVCYPCYEASESGPPGSYCGRYRTSKEAGWSDVQQKAKGIRSSGGVKIISVTEPEDNPVYGHTYRYIVAEVSSTSGGEYESIVQFVPGTAEIADWSCTCPWGEIRNPANPSLQPSSEHLQGRKCAHVEALWLEVQSRGMFGKEIREDFATAAKSELAGEPAKPEAEQNIIYDVGPDEGFGAPTVWLRGKGTTTAKEFLKANGFLWNRGQHAYQHHLSADEQAELWAALSAQGFNVKPQKEAGLKTALWNKADFFAQVRGNTRHVSAISYDEYAVTVDGIQEPVLLDEVFYPSYHPDRGLRVGRGASKLATGIPDYRKPETRDWAEEDFGDSFWMSGGCGAYAEALVRTFPGLKAYASLDHDGSVIHAWAEDAQGNAYDVRGKGTRDDWSWGGGYAPQKIVPLEAVEDRLQMSLPLIQEAMAEIEDGMDGTTAAKKTGPQVEVDEHGVKHILMPDGKRYPYDKFHYDPSLWRFAAWIDFSNIDSYDRVGPVEQWSLDKVQSIRQWSRQATTADIAYPRARWEKLKESLKAEGILHPFLVGDRYADDRETFDVLEDGNHRLAIIEEILDESPEYATKFQTVPVQKVHRKDLYVANKMAAGEQIVARGLKTFVEDEAIARRLLAGTATVDDLVHVVLADNGTAGIHWWSQAEFPDAVERAIQWAKDEPFEETVAKYVADNDASDDPYEDIWGECLIALVGKTGETPDEWSSAIMPDTPIELIEIHYDAGNGWRKVPAQGRKVVAMSNSYPLPSGKGHFRPFPQGELDAFQDAQEKDAPPRCGTCGSSNLSEVLGVSGNAIEYDCKDCGATTPVGTAKQAQADLEGLMVAFDLPEAVKEALKEPGGEPVEQMHLTLVYLGKAADFADQQGAITQAVREWAETYQPLEGSIAGYGVWDTDDGKVLTASVDVVGMSRAREDLVNRLKMHSVDFEETHDFNAHVTIKYYDAGELPEMPASVPTAAKNFTLDTVLVAFGKMANGESIKLGVKTVWQSIYADPAMCPTCGVKAVYQNIAHVDAPPFSCASCGEALQPEPVKQADKIADDGTPLYGPWDGLLRNMEGDTTKFTDLFIDHEMPDRYLLVPNTNDQLSTANAGVSNIRVEEGEKLLHEKVDGTVERVASREVFVDTDTVTDADRFHWSLKERLGQTEHLSKLPETQTCKYCSDQATKRIIWAEGRAYIPVCNGHEGKAKERVAEQNDEVTEVRSIGAYAEPNLNGGLPRPKVVSYEVPLDDMRGTSYLDTARGDRLIVERHDGSRYRIAAGNADPSDVYVWEMDWGYYVSDGKTGEQIPVLGTDGEENRESGHTDGGLPEAIVEARRMFPDRPISVVEDEGHPDGAERVEAKTTSQNGFWEVVAAFPGKVQKLSFQSAEAAEKQGQDLTLDGGDVLIVSPDGEKKRLPKLGELQPGDPSLSYLSHGITDNSDIAAGARAKMAELGTLSPEEAQAILVEGEAEGIEARNLSELALAGTHYETLETALREQESQIQEAPVEDLFL